MFLTERKNHRLEVLLQEQNGKYHLGVALRNEYSSKKQPLPTSVTRGYEWSGKFSGQLGWNRAAMHPYDRDAWFFVSRETLVKP